MAYQQRLDLLAHMRFLARYPARQVVGQDVKRLFQAVETPVQSVETSVRIIESGVDMSL